MRISDWSSDVCSSDLADAPGAVATMPSFPPWGFALAILGGLWMLLWQTRWRRAGAMPLMIGIAALLATPRPDLLVTGDGRHIAAAQPDGSYALLRDRDRKSTRLNSSH